ncbi:MAG: cellulase family glycosylhydrolase [Opitutae bacterium]|nr:cellulase family glycosylhydrolase [Opitutae bacterium]
MSTSRNLRQAALCALATILLAVSATAAARRSAQPPLRAAGDKFLDATGRQVILHGLNLVDKSADWTDYAWVGEQDYAAMRDWGFNCIRLGFTWASIEPQPGQYSEKAIVELKKRVAWAKKYGLQVVLDMHQDLYSMKYSDGAPEWATLTDGRPHIADGKVWSDAYVTSPAVQTSMDNFYANKEGPGGVGLQDRYAGAWRFIARHFADEPTVVGYDLMNEPFAGSLVAQGMMLHFAQLAKELGKPGEKGLAEILALWGTPEGRKELLKQVGDEQLYARVLGAAQPLFQEFERKRLNPFFQKVSRAIREVDASHLIFLETNGASNMGVYTAIEPLSLRDGKRDPQQAYAPHGYDLVTDTPDVATASNSRIHLIFVRHQESSRRLGLPMLVGEWGAYYGDAKILPSAQYICRQFEQMLCGDTYWALEKDMATQAVMQALCRPYPMAVAGVVSSYRSDPEARTFECTWTEAGAGESRFYLPASYHPRDGTITVQPAGARWRFEPVGQTDACYLVVPSRPQAGSRTLTFTPKRS